jgi:hypothetical protein
LVDGKEDDIMAMEISNAYSSYVSNSTYTTKNNNQKQAAGSNGAEKVGSETNSSSRSTAADELSYLSKKYSNYSFVSANYSRGMQYGSSSTVNVAISPQFLAKMASDPELEAEYEENIAAMQKLDEQEDAMDAGSGWHVVARGWVIDKDGGISKWGIVQKDDGKSFLQKMSDNAEKIREKNAERKKQQADIEEKLRISKKEKAEIEEEMQEAGKKQFGERFKDATVLTVDDKEAYVARNEKGKEETVGISLDMKI